MQNGKLTKTELAPIFHPTLRLFLAAGEAAAAWNSMRLFLLFRFGKNGEIFAEGPLGSYRDLAGQVKCKEQFGKNAAIPGNSNHGLGRAVDLATHPMADLVDRFGSHFGWHHWDAKWEWWHREYDGGFGRPDPGPDEKNPVLSEGSGGPGQFRHVVLLQRRLNLHTGAGIDPDGDFGSGTNDCLMAFQRSQGLKANGVADAATWALLRQAPSGPRRKPKPKAAQPQRRLQAVSAAPVRGFDVSDAQGDVDFGKARNSGAAFVSVRVADGDVHDVRYGPGRVKALRACGLAWFPYYFGRVASDHNGQRDGAAEAKMAIRFARDGGWGNRGDLPLAYDFEVPNKQPPKKCARHLIQFIRAYRADRGHYPIIYTMPSFWNSILPQFNAGNRKLIARCPLWIASWQVPAPPALGPWGSSWALWQNSDRGTIAGVTGKCDTDIFNGAAADFSRLIVT